MKIFRSTSLIRVMALGLALLTFGSNVSMAFAAPPTKEEMKALRETSLWYDPTAVADVCTEGGSGSVTVEPGENKRAALKYFYDRGLTIEQAAGFVGNLEAESGVQPDINERNPTVPGSRGGYGIAQWTGGRRVALENFAAIQNKNVADLQFQLDYLWNQELLIAYKSSVLDPLKQTTTVKAASDIVLTKFEIPGVIINGSEAQKTALKDKRAGLGNAILQLYGNEISATAPTGPGTAEGGSPISTACGGSGGSGTFVGFPLDTNKARMKQLNGGCFSDAEKKMCEGGHPYAAFDIMADAGTPVLSILAGVVEGRYTDKCGGTMISVYSQAEDVTVSYLHLSPQLPVKNGDAVQAGQVIANVGNNAAACGTGSHLHIDAAPSRPRPGCRREDCPAANQAKFRAGEQKINLAASLYDGYSKLPEGGNANL